MHSSFALSVAWLCVVTARVGSEATDYNEPIGQYKAWKAGSWSQLGDNLADKGQDRVDMSDDGNVAVVWKRDGQVSNVKVHKYIDGNWQNFGHLTGMQWHQLMDLSLSPDGTKLAVGSNRNGFWVALWDLTSGGAMPMKKQWKPAPNGGNGNYPYSYRVLLANNRIIAKDMHWQNKPFFAFDIDQNFEVSQVSSESQDSCWGAERIKIFPSPSEVEAYKYRDLWATTRDASRIVSHCGRNVWVYQWSASSYKEFGNRWTLNGDLTSVAITPDGKRIAIGVAYGTFVRQGNSFTNSGEVGVWDEKDGQFTRTATVVGRAVANGMFGSRVALSEDGTWLVVGAKRDSVDCDNKGSIWFFQSTPTGWVQLPEILKGSACHDRLGFDLAINSDVTRMAVAFTVQQHDPVVLSDGLPATTTTLTTNTTTLTTLTSTSSTSTSTTSTTTVSITTTLKAIFVDKANMGTCGCLILACVALAAESIMWT